MQNLPTAYEHNVFLSYRRSFLIQNWITKFFLPYFEGWLEEELLKLETPDSPALRDAHAPHVHDSANKVGVFFDQKSIEPGDPWPEDLQRAVQASKILVAICSPTYFHSSWCLSEWRSFVERQTILGVSGLIIPVRYHDSEDFLAGIAWSDFSEYTIQASDFYQSAQAVSFETEIRKLASVVARAVKGAPTFQSGWPSPHVKAPPAASPSMHRL
jgi:hypothetical protein